jgi:hypothetical protein
MKHSAVLFLAVASLQAAACDRTSADSTPQPEQGEASAKGAPKADAVETGGTLTINDWGVNDKKDVTMKIGRAFAYVVTVAATDDEDDPKTVHKLAEIVLYNDGAKDVSCSTKIGDFRDDKLIGGSHYAVSLQGRDFVELEFGKAMDIGGEYSPCLWHPDDFGKGVEQRSGCGYAFVGSEDVQLTSISKTRVAGKIAVTSSTHGHENFIKGTFVAEVCPIVPLDKFLER